MGIFSRPNSCHVYLLEDGLNQVLTSPHEFSLPSREVVIRKEGERLIIEPMALSSLISGLATLDPLEEDFPNVDESLPLLDEIVL